MTIDVEKEFAFRVQALGGIVLDDTLKAPLFKNADYWFPQENVVAEMKQLHEDMAEKADFKQKISELYNSWVQRNLIPPPTQKKVTINSQDLPELCAYEFLEVMKKRIEFSTIKKANSQVRETKEFFNSPNAKGLLILVNDGNLLMEPSVMAHLLARILKGKYSKIHSVIYFSVNVLASVPNMPQPSPFWMDCLVPDREPISRGLLSRLQEQWFSHVSKLIHGPIYEVLMPPSLEIVEQIKLR